MDKYRIGDIVTLMFANQEVSGKFGYITDIDIVRKEIKVRWFDGNTFWHIAQYVVVQ